MRIRTTMLALGLTLAFAVAPAFAASASAASKPMTAQQQKMAACSHQSKGMKGDAHKQFMSNCLKGNPTTATAPAASAPATSAPAKVSQQQKMKTCSADAKTKGLKGTARKSYMSTCLKG